MFGEDVGALGGVFRVTEGLQAEFGRERVFDTPIAEAGIAGICVGLAMAGWRPIAEMQFDGFSYPALDQVISHVAKYRERTRGRVAMPVVIRIPSFGGIRGKEHHGESPETYYVHTAGLKVVVPSTPLDAYRLLRRSIDDPDPVIFLEPKSRYWSKEDGELTVGGTGHRAGAGRPRGRAPASLIAYGAMVAPMPRGRRRAWPRRASSAASSTSARWSRSTSRRSATPSGRPDAPSSCTRRRSRSGWAPRSWRGSWRRRSTTSRRRSRASPGRTCPYPPASLEQTLPPERRADLERRPHGGRLLMAERVFTLPDLGEGLEEAIVSAWLVAEGDDGLAEPAVRRDRDGQGGRSRCPRRSPGRVARLHVAAGDTLAVGAPLVDVRGRRGREPAGSARPDAPASSAGDGGASGGGSPVPRRVAGAATPAVRRLARDLGVDLPACPGPGPAAG